MSKILNRPMFRGGGRVDSRGTGIVANLEYRVPKAMGGMMMPMTMGYNMGGQVTPKRGLVDGPGGYAGIPATVTGGQLLQQTGALLPYSEMVERQKKAQEILGKDFKTAKELGEEYDIYKESLDPTMLYGIDEFGPGTYGESIEQKYRAASEDPLEQKVKESYISEKLAEQQKLIDQARELGITEEQLPNLLTKKKEEPTITPKTDAGVGAGVKTQPTESDLKTLYQDLLPLFEKELGPEADEYSRQKYMQLAKFGLGLLAQPGGSLVEAIGKAGEKPLAGLEAVATREAQARKAPRMLALEAALKQVDPTDIIKKVKALSKLSGIPQEQVAKSMVTTTADVTADASVDKFLREGAINLNLSGGAALNYSKQIKSIFENNPSLAGKFTKTVPQKPVEGEYYVTKSGDLTRYKNNQFLTPADKGFAN